MTKQREIVWYAALAVMLCAGTSAAEEIWRYDNSRVFGLVRGVEPGGVITILQPTGEEIQTPLADVVAIRFLGRTPLLVQSGTQEFRFLDGGSIRGRILENQGDDILVETAIAGTIRINPAHLKGFVALPLIGFSGRKAEELVESEQGRTSASLDVVLDRRGSTYPGVIRKLDRQQIELDHEDLLQVVPVRIMYVAGVRLADAGRARRKPWQGDLQIRIRGRDGSLVQGVLKRIYLGRWFVEPAWDPDRQLEIDVEEIAQVDVMGGRVQYLSQLTPVEVSESTILAPPQPYRVDRSSQGDAISIAGRRYPRGIGVHADAQLTFDLGGRFREFRADVGIATRIGERGSVVFTVEGDGKPLFTSEVITGARKTPLEIKVPIAGVKQLSLKATNAGDLDLGDVANWGSARVLR